MLLFFPFQSFQAHEKGITGLQVTDHLIITASLDTTIKVWDKSSLKIKDDVSLNQVTIRCFYCGGNAFISKLMLSVRRNFDVLVSHRKIDLLTKTLHCLTIFGTLVTALGCLKILGKFSQR